jgi:hypothetical protein
MLHFRLRLRMIRIAALHASGHRAAHVGKRLMPVEAAQLDVFPVQHETLRVNSRFAETDAALDEACHVERWMLAQDILGLRDDILDVGGWDDAQRYFAINSAEREVINAIAKGRNIRALGRIDVHSEQIVSVKI